MLTMVKSTKIIITRINTTKITKSKMIKMKTKDYLNSTNTAIKTLKTI